MDIDAHRYRKSRPALAAVCLLLLAALPSLAIDVTKLKPQGYVSDFAGVLNDSSRGAIERYCGEVERATGAQMAIVTVDTLDGTPIEDFTGDLFRRWGVGKKGKDEGVMLLLAIKDRQSRMEVGYGLEPILPDGFVGSVLREMRPSLREENYGAALQAGAAAIGDKIAAAKGATIQRTLPRREPAPSQGGGGGIPIFTIIFVIVVFLLVARGGGGGGFLAGMLLGNLFGRGGRDRDWGGGGWGGGGFGGGDSGGFGGFGGGDSGGGGASGSW